MNSNSVQQRNHQNLKPGHQRGKKTVLVHFHQREIDCLLERGRRHRTEMDCWVLRRGYLPERERRRRTEMGC